MSECVVRMEMPEDCPMCPMSHWNKQDEFTGCEVAPGKMYEMLRSKEYRDSNTRPDWCPILYQLPEGHGRLVDINIVAKKIKDAEELSEFCDEFEFGGRWTVDLSKIPTIVPAERREE